MKNQQHVSISGFRPLSHTNRHIPQPAKLISIGSDQIGKTTLLHQIMAVVLPVHINVDAAEDQAPTGSEVANTEAKAIGIPPAEEADLPIKSADTISGTKKEPTLLTKKESSSPIKKGSNSPAKRDFVSPMEVTVTLNTDDAEHNEHVEQKNLEVPVKKAPPCYGPNNSARRATRRRGEAGEAPAAPAARPSSPLLTPDSRSPASSRPASPFSPASPAVRRHSLDDAKSPAARATSQRRPSAPVVSAPSPTPQFTHPQLMKHPLRNSRSMKDTREGGRSEEQEECTWAPSWFGPKISCLRNLH